MKNLPPNWRAESYLPVDEAARVLLRHPEQVRRYLREGRFPTAVKIGLMWYIPRADVLAFKARLRRRGARPARERGAA